MRRPSRLAVVLVLLATAVFIVAGAGAIAYALPPWLFDREVRAAASDRYANLGDPSRIEEIVDAHHAEVFAQCFPEGARRVEKTFAPHTYNRLMDARVRSGLASAPPPERVEGPTMPAPDSAVVPTAAPLDAATEPSTGVVRVLALSASRVSLPEGFSVPGIPLRLLLEVEGLEDDTFVRDPDAITLTISCPEGEHASLAPVSEGASENLGSSRRFVFRVTVPPSALGSNKGVCTMAAAVRDPSGNEGRLEQFVAIR